MVNPTASIPPNYAGLVRREGLSVLYDPADCKLDLVIVHGLNGSPYRTFSDSTTSFYWPEHVYKTLPSARVMVFGYNADLSTGSSNVLGISQHGESLLLHLRNNRIGADKQRQPIIFIGHSLGGIVIKQALVISSLQPANDNILQSTKLIFFLGTPHRGSHLLDKSFSKAYLSMMKLANKEVPKNVKTVLQPRGDESFIVNTDFMRVKGNISIVNFYEQVPTSRIQDLVVDKDSAVFDSEHSENIPLARDHHHLVRFESASDDAYNTICQTLKRKVSYILSELAQSAHNGYSQQMMRACLQSLGDSRLPSGLPNAKEVHHKTLAWVRSTDSELSRWLKSSSGIFAVTGKPGSGKSFLMNEVGKQARKKSEYEFDAIVQHAFSSRGTPQEHSFESFLRMAIKKLLRQCPLSFDAILDEWLTVASDAGFTEAELCDSEDVGIIHWPISSLKKALHTISTQIARYSRICFIIDALDECDDANGGIGDIVSFLHTISSTKTVATDKSGVCVCISCRDLPSTVDRIVAGGFRMEACNEPDISAYINDRWSTLSTLVGPSDEMKQLKKDLIQRADGIFLWADLALERIQTALDDGSTVAELREIIDEIPDELGGLFAFLLSNINPNYSQEASMMLALVLCAQRPLSVREFRYAMALTSSSTIKFHKDLEVSRAMVKDDIIMKRRIQSRCGGLLEVKVAKESWPDDRVRSGHTHIVQFMHQSVRDYLLSSSNPNKHGVPEFDTLISQGHVALARCSIQYLGLNEMQDLARHAREESPMGKYSNILRFPFLHYAGNFCFCHFQEAEKHGSSQTGLIDEHFGADEGAFENYVTIYNSTHQGDKMISGFSLLQVAIESNLASYVDLILSRNASDVDVRLESGQTCVQLAVWREHHETLKVLLAHGADPNLFVTVKPSTSTKAKSLSEDENDKYQPPLVMACRKGNADIVQTLLDNGAQARDCNTTQNGLLLNQALVAAAYSGKSEIVKLLLETDPLTFAHPEIRFGAILGLAHASDEVLSDDSRYYQQNYDQRLDANLQATKRISHLIFSDMDIYELDFEANSASYFWYLTGCRYEVLQRFLELDSDLSGAGSDGLSFLHAACLQGNVASVQLLLRNRADPSATYGSRVSSCLHLATGNETPAVLEYLLKLGLPANAIDCFGDTPLHGAAHVRSHEFIDSLLRHGADRTLQNMMGQTPFHRAISNRQLRDPVTTLKMLMSDSSDIQLPDRHGITPLHTASRCGALAIVQWLLDEAADASAIDEYGRTVLHMAAASASPDSTDVLATLLDRNKLGLDINQQDSADMTPLHHVFWQYESTERDRLRTPDPALAAANAALLVQNGADLGARDNAGNTPLHMAAWRGVMEAVRLFLRRGADPTAKDVNGLRPLDVAEMEGVRELLEQAEDDRPPEYRMVIR